MEAPLSISPVHRRSCLVGLANRYAYSLRKTTSMNSTGTPVIDYRIRNHDMQDPRRRVEVQATAEQLDQLAREGYMVRERLISGDQLERLRSAVDELAAGAREGQDVAGSRRFGGLFVRNLLDRHPAFLEMLKFGPTLSVARAALGPQVQVHAMVMRVTYPDQPNQETHWHFHQRVIPDPLPVFFSRPQVLDNLIYLDDIDEATGPLCVVPGTHREDLDLPANQHDDKPGQKVLCVPAGSCVTAHANLWHRAMPTTPGGQVRRLIILGYSPVWMKPIDRWGGGLTDALLPDADAETRELLGLSGYY
jgi:ectoine hydroxylase-related dioxygenase (phytanoyl-CoA dioxygenase family)